MDINRELKRHERVIRAAATRYAAKLIADRPHEFDDVMSEARIAAWRAIESYDASRKVKIETYIFNCVRNKIFDMAKHARRNGRALASPDEHIEQLADEDTIPAVEHAIQLRQALSEDEINFIDCVRRGGGVVRFISELSRMTGKTSKEATSEVSECLRHIQHKLSSSETSPKVLTLRPRSRKSAEGTI